MRSLGYSPTREETASYYAKYATSELYVCACACMSMDTYYVQCMHVHIVLFSEETDENTVEYIFFIL